jgi:hypothetical protein
MPRSLPLLLILLGSLVPAAGWSQQAFLSGSVSRATGGAPLSGMTVAVYSAEGGIEPVARVDSSGDGGWNVAVPAPGTYRIVAWDPNKSLATEFYRQASSFETSAEFSVAPEQTITGIDFKLVTAAHIHGQVTMKSSGTPLVGMTVAAYNLDGTRRAHEKTGSGGAYGLTLPPGKYKLVSWDDSGTLAPQFYASKKRFDEATIVDAAGSVSGVSFALTTGARVSGRVFVQGGTQPLPGIRIAALDIKENAAETGHVSSGPDGKFQFTLPAGVYKFVASDDKGVYETEFARNVTTYEAAATFSLSTSPLTGLDFSLTPRTDPPAPTVQWLPAAANGPGAFLSYWQTDLWLHNPHPEPLAIELAYIAQEMPGVEAARVTRVIPPRGQLEIANVVASISGRTGNGAIRLEGPKPFVANSRTFNTPANASEAGTFGFSMPAFHRASTLSSAVLSGIANGPNVVYRSNIGVFNPHDHPIELTYRLFASNGSSLGESVEKLDPLEWKQTNLASLPGLPGPQVNVKDAYLVIRSQTGSFYSYASLVDNRSNDPSLILPSADLRVEE